MNNKFFAGLILLAAFWVNSGDTSVLLPVRPKSPVPGKGFHVLIVEDRLHRQQLPPEKFDAIMSPEITAIITQAGGRKYLYDQEQNVEAKNDPWLTAAMKVPRKALPWVVIDNDGKGTAAEVVNVQQFKELVQQHVK